MNVRKLMVHPRARCRAVDSAKLPPLFRVYEATRIWAAIRVCSNPIELHWAYAWRGLIGL